MFTLAAMVILYVFGFVFLYAVIRVSVRHAMEDLEVRRAEALRMERMAAERDRDFMQQNAFLANG
ncbi:hypothetical protein E1091_04020 [Micromonospora fluostatini]|uniref:Uncharacterized protein n=2 Tax=Micromonospora TaxID=1873 RepID=A0A136PUK7_9ACTN|nr:hypothetical protein [Micromonospora rosaria]KXK61836.1 hypothetical protein AWW66_11680 [Micromonospora rosaria]TDC00847.1 hypothetical protein E1091_04020 [Micromonospora fluostatini]